MKTLRVLVLLWSSGLLPSPADGPTISPSRVLGRYQQVVWQELDGLPANGINAIARTPDGVRFTTFDSVNTPAIRNNNVQHLLVDRAGALWIGTHAGGVTRNRDGRFTHFSTEDGLSDNRARSFYEDRLGGVWVGTEAGVSVFRDGRFTVYSTADGLPNDHIMAITGDPTGGIWMGTLAGLVQARDGRFTTYTTRDGLPSNRIHALAWDRAGSLWVGTDSGVSRYHDERFTTLDLAPGTSPAEIRTIVEDRQGAVWVGTARSGLYRLEHGRVTAISTRDGLASDAIQAIHEGPDGDLWPGGAGLVQLRVAPFMAYTPKDGLQLELVRPIHEDSSGGIWVGTDAGLARFTDGSNKGIYRARLQALNDFADGRIAAVQSFSYGTADGMLSRECNGANPAGVKARDGRLWFPTIRGIVVVDPRQLDQRPPTVVIEGLTVESQPQPLDRAVRMSPGQDTLEIQYTALSWNRPSQVRFKYQLVGLLRRGHRRSDTDGSPGVGSLPAAERRGLALLGELKTTKQIALELGVSPRTIDNHRANLCAKLGLQGPHALTRFALEHKRSAG